jgi:hypothetical protein
MHPPQVSERITRAMETPQADDTILARSHPDFDQCDPREGGKPKRSRNGKAAKRIELRQEMENLFEDEDFMSEMPKYNKIPQDLYLGSYALPESQRKSYVCAIMDLYFTGIDSSDILPTAAQKLFKSNKPRVLTARKRAVTITCGIKTHETIRAETEEPAEPETPPSPDHAEYRSQVMEAFRETARDWGVEFSEQDLGNIDRIKDEGVTLDEVKEVIEAFREYTEKINPEYFTPTMLFGHAFPSVLQQVRSQ